MYIELMEVLWNIREAEGRDRVRRQIYIEGHCPPENPGGRVSSKVRL
jgi:hypothetical protein